MPGYNRSTIICAGVCLLGAVMSWFGFRSGTGKASAPAPAEVNVT